MRGSRRRRSQSGPFTADVRDGNTSLRAAVLSLERSHPLRTPPGCPSRPGHRQDRHEHHDRTTTRAIRDTAAEHVERRRRPHTHDSGGATAVVLASRPDATGRRRTPLIGELLWRRRREAALPSCAVIRRRTRPLRFVAEQVVQADELPSRTTTRGGPYCSSATPSVGACDRRDPSRTQPQGIPPTL